MTDTPLPDRLPTPLAELPPQGSDVDTQVVYWRADAAVAASRLGQAPLSAMQAPWHLCLALHDWMTGPAAAAWGQPRVRLAGARTLAERAMVGGVHHLAAGPTATYWLGFAGQFWFPWRPLAAPPLAAFLAWRHPYTTRVTWRFTLSPHHEDVALEMTLRAHSVDRAARAAFAAYMAVAGPASRALRRQLLRGLAQRCGMPPSSGKYTSLARVDG